MTIILRLQGLDEKAGTQDIRRFFKCLRIPDGGVYIVGGSLREAFIAFTSERDAQLAMRYSGTFLKGSKVTLHLSSMEELERKLKLLLKRKKSSAMHLTVKSPQSSPDAKLQLLNEGPHSPNTPNISPTTTSPRDPRTVNRVQPLCAKPSNLQPSEALDAFILGMCTVIQSLQSSHQRESDDPVPRVDFSNACSTDPSDDRRTPEQTPGSKPGYVRLFGLPASATKEIICHFFRGLTVKDAIVNVELGLSHGCLVKFASEQEARDALLFNQRSLDSFCVEVRGATEKMWTMTQQECEKTFELGEWVKPKKGPLKETANHKQKSTTFQMKRQSDNWLPSKLLKKPRLEGDRTASSSPMEYIVMVRNLPITQTKTEIKELFECPHISHKNVQHLLDKEGNRTDTAFIIFNRTEDYDYAMTLTGCHVGSKAIEVSCITKTMMKDMMNKTHPRRPIPDPKEKPNQKRKSPVNADPAFQTCLFVRNMPADVRKSQIKRLFSNYRLKKDDIILLRDRNGKSIGEAVVQFKSQKLTVLAQRLQGQDFLGSRLFLTPITVKQMEEILTINV